ncbi:MAG: NADPH-dependent FMN reductase [Pseudomonadota bacterium]
MSEPTLLLISGSLRKGSYNRALLRQAANAFGPANVIEGDIDFPLYNGDLEEAEGAPQKVKDLSEQLKSADALIVSSPEYNKGVSGVLKNALDWLSRVDFAAFKGKPTVVLSAAAGRTGGETGLFMTQSCLSQFQVRFIFGPPIMVAAAHKEFDADGNFTGEVYADMLKLRMQELRSEIS